MGKKKLSDDELSALLAKVISQAEHLTDGKLSREREEVGQYYRGELPKPIHKGDSKYVSRDVFDTVDSMRATVLEAYSANTNIVYFKPEKGETVGSAKQASDYTRHTFFKDNDGEQILYDSLTDGLMNRFCVSKVYGEEIEEEDDYEFEALTKEELAMSVQKHQNYEFVETDITPEGLYSGTYRVTKKTKKIRTELIQPEDFLVVSGAPTLDKSKGVAHRFTMKRSDVVKKVGEKKADELVYTSASAHTFDFEKQSRFNALGEVVGSGESVDEANKEVLAYEIYVEVDMDGKGVAKLWKFLYVSGHILERERVAFMPFAVFVPLPIPHTFHGENFAKAVIPVQNTRTVLIRQIVNHSLITNNPRLQVLNGSVPNPQELLDNRLGGIVNVRRMDGLMPLPQAPLNPYVFNLISMIDEDKEETTGISKLSQGMNKEAISTQNSQGMVEQLISASQQRQKIIARRFGKYLKDMWWLIYHTATSFVDEAEYIETTGSYVEVKPSEWMDRTAASVELSLSQGEAEKESMKWAEIDAYFVNDPDLKAMYSIDRRYNVIKRSLEKKGIEDIESILTPPDQMEPPAPDPMQELQKKQIETQIAYQQAQAQAMMSKAETDKMKAQADLIRAHADAGYKKDEISLAMQELAHKKMVDTAELALASKATEQKAIYNPDA